MVKSCVFAGAVGGLLLAGSAFGSPYLGMELELVNSGAQGNSYRMYVLLEEGSRIDAVYGNSLGDLEISSSTGFYQDGFGGATSTSINESFFALAPSLEWDSYVSIGALYANGGGGFSSNALNDVGLTEAKEAFEAGGALVTDNGSWFVTSADPQGEELDGRVFIGQFTVSGDASSITGQVNLQGKTADGENFNVIGASWVPAPGALALLGLAGLTGRRRRR